MEEVFSARHDSGTLTPSEKTKRPPSFESTSNRRDTMKLSGNKRRGLSDINLHRLGALCG